MRLRNGMSRLFTTAVDINAPPQRVWAVMSDIERWHEWTASVSSVERLDASPLAVGSRVRIRQPRLSPALFVVTAFEEGRGFIWETSSPGVRAIADHWIEEIAGGSRVTLLLRFAGLIGPSMAFFMRNLIHRYMEMEAAGLKQRCEK